MESDTGIEMQELLQRLKKQSIQLRLEGEQLRVIAPQGAMTPDLRETLVAHKEQLLELLRDDAEQEDFAALAPDPQRRHEPFALTDIQRAYWMGRNSYVELGGVSTHFYLEYERTGLDLERLNASLQKLIARHDMLRAVIDPDGRQRILPTVPPYRIAALDLRGKPAAEQESAIQQIRDAMSHQVLPADRWPLFEIRATQLDQDRLRVHFSVDMLIADVWSMTLFVQEWRDFYQDAAWTPPALALSYRDYVEAEQTLQEHPLYQRAKKYWLQRLDDLPPAPDLPLAPLSERREQSRFARRRMTLSAQQWDSLKERTQQAGVTPSAFILTAFSEVLRLWSKQPDFTINMTLFNRLPLHAQVNQIIGDFTSVNLMGVQGLAQHAFVERVAQLQRQVSQDLMHTHFNGVRVMRERARRMGHAPGAMMPIVFTSSIGLGGSDDASDATRFFGEYVFGVSQTPQVWLDHQVFEEQGRLVCNWDAVEALFPPGLLDDMFASYASFLQRLAEDDADWSAPDCAPRLPDWQIEERRRVNATQADIPKRTLHGLVAATAARFPEAVAVITEKESITYRELSARAYRLARRLRECGVRRNTLIAVALDKGWEQIAAVLGVLHAGAAYLPVDPDFPLERRCALVRQGEADIVITQACLQDAAQWPAHVRIITMDDDACGQYDDSPLDVVQSPADVAYVIFTSGSTGKPKGVTIDHQGACNTIQDINQRFHVGPEDRVLALSALNFDLSVYDIFGILGAGGTVVMPSPEKVADPLHWSELVTRHRVTIWNSVPALLQLWADHLQDAGCHCAVRLAMLSGDWIPVKLPDQIRSLVPGLKVVSLGGATEASIWSVFYPIDVVAPEWTSVPYGKPLANQTLHVYNAWFEPCPVWTVGQIYIGGAGLALGYWGDAERTAERFVTHPGTGERLYKTGDLGRYLPGGDIEFLGREDFQVKINGYRIELGEIEAALRRQSGVREALVHVAARAKGAQRQLIAYVVPESPAQEAPMQLSEALAAVLPGYMVPHYYVQLAALPLSANGKVDCNALPLPWRLNAQALAHVAPRNADEQRLFQVWKDLLGHAEFGVEDNFFALGADSINVAQMMGKIGTAFDLSAISQQILFQRFFSAPTIAGFALALGQLRASATEASEQSASAAEQEPLPVIVPDPANLYEPFPLSDLQSAYLAGQMEDMEYHVESNYYLEIDYDEIFDAPRYEQALNAMLQRQRANLPLLTENMQLQIPRVLPPVKLAVRDLRGLPLEEAQAVLQQVRQALSRRVMPLEQWPWVAFAISLYDGKTRLHINTSNFFADAFGGRLFADANHYYHHPDQPLPALTLSYRDAVLATKRIEESARGKASQRYWLDRIPTLPGPPAIPLAAHENPRSRSKLQRREMILPEKIWSAFKAMAAAHGVTATNAVYAVYAEVLAHWSGSRHFLISNVRTQRLPLHPQVRDIIGNFAAVYPLEIDWRNAAPFHARARDLQMQLIRDAQNIYWNSSGIWQSLNRFSKTPGRAVSPFVVASALDMPAWNTPGFACLDTPQVLIEHQLRHLADGSFWATWDVNERFFPPGLVDAMLDAYRALLILLAEDAAAWTKESITLPRDRCGQWAPEKFRVQAPPAVSVASVGSASTGRYTALAPRTPVEAELVTIWEEILAVSPIGVQDDFFELGGHSLAAVQVMTRIAKRFGRRLALGALLQGRTIEKLAQSLQQEQA